MPYPYISVIVTDYKRKKYLLSAVRSALNQTLSRDLYEVIVVKNYRDQYIDSQLNEWKVTNAYSNNPSNGGMLYEGLQLARGEVASFLDDDEFFPRNLRQFTTPSRGVPITSITVT